MFCKLKLSSFPIFLFAFSVFLFVELCDALLPFSSAHAGSGAYLIYYIFFIIFFLSLGLSAFWKCSVRCNFPEIGSIKQLAVVFLAISFVALFFVLYDRIFLQGVNYEDGVALARENWRAEASERSGASSVYSVIGNLMFPLVYFSFALSCIFYEQHKAFRMLIVLSFILILGFSLITGGRELLLVLVAVLISSVIIRKFQALPLVPKGLRLKLITILSVVFLFAIYIAYSRSESYTEGLAWYANSLATRLGGVHIKSHFIGEYTPEIIMPVLIYVAHVKWVFLNVIESSVFGGLSTFRQFFLMLDGYTPLPENLVYFAPPSYTPNWISLIGSVYYDCGVFGFLLFCIFMLFSISASFMSFRVAAFNRSMFSIFLGVFLFSIVVMSPFAFIFEIVQFVYFLLPLAFSFFLSFLLSFGVRRERRFY